MKSRAVEALFANTPPTPNFLARISKDEASGCWNWMGRTDADGYGIFSKKKRPMRAHRFSYVMHVGLPPESKPLVLHECNNKGCVNPNHLYAGDFFDNERDKLKFGTRARGVTAGISKLDDEKIYKIREMLIDGSTTLTAIGELFGVRRQTISKIQKGTIWKHI